MVAQIISIGGTQGCGKTTTIKALANLDFPCDIYSVARAVQQKFNAIQLEDMLQDEEICMAFQTEILREKIRRDLETKARTDVGLVLVERCVADVWAYTKIWSERFGVKFKTWMEDVFYDECINAQLDIQYYAVVLCPLDTFEAEPNRANEETRFLVDRYIKDFLYEVSLKSGVLSFEYIFEKDLDERVIVIDAIARDIILSPSER